MLTCSFCGLEAPAVGTLLAGPDVNICDKCVAIAVRVIETQAVLERPASGTEDRTNAPDDLLLCEIATTAELVDRTRDTLQGQIRELRRRGIDWSVIGTALGVSHQVAQERFG